MTDIRYLVGLVPLVKPSIGRVGSRDASNLIVVDFPIDLHVEMAGFPNKKLFVIGIGGFLGRGLSGVEAILATLQSVSLACASSSTATKCCTLAV